MISERLTQIFTAHFHGIRGAVTHILQRGHVCILLNLKPGDQRHGHGFWIVQNLKTLVVTSCKHVVLGIRYIGIKSNQIKSNKWKLFKLNSSQPVTWSTTNTVIWINKFNDHFNVSCCLSINSVILLESERCHCSHTRWFTSYSFLWCTFARVHVFLSASIFKFDSLLVKAWSITSRRSPNQIPIGWSETSFPCLDPLHHHAGRWWSICIIQTLELYLITFPVFVAIPGQVSKPVLGHRDSTEVQRVFGTHHIPFRNLWATVGRARTSHVVKWGLEWSRSLKLVLNPWWSFFEQLFRVSSAGGGGREGSHSSTWLILSRWTQEAFAWALGVLLGEGAHGPGQRDPRATVILRHWFYSSTHGPGRTVRQDSITLYSTQEPHWYICGHQKVIVGDTL